MVGTTRGLSRKHLHSSALQQPRPLRLNVVWIGRQAVSDIVDENEHFQTINGRWILHLTFTSRFPNSLEFHLHACRGSRRPLTSPPQSPQTLLYETHAIHSGY